MSWTEAIKMIWGGKRLGIAASVALAIGAISRSPGAAGLGLALMMHALAAASWSSAKKDESSSAEALKAREMGAWKAAMAGADPSAMSAMGAEKSALKKGAFKALLALALTGVGAAFGVALWGAGLGWGALYAIGAGASIGAAIQSELKDIDEQSKDL